jgi:hypothetical protein
VVCDGQAVKVGIAQDIPQRIKQLQTGNPARLVLMHSIEIPSAPRWMVERAERLIHAYLASERVSGEWFMGRKTRALLTAMSKQNPVNVLQYMVFARP